MIYETIEATEIGMQTLVGSSGDYPREVGNCFDLICGDKSVRIVNFIVENLEKLLEDKVIEWPIKVHILKGRTAIIHDERIPHEWYDKSFCEVCCPQPLLPIQQQLRIARDILSGDRVEKVCEDGMVIVTQKLKANKRKLKENWTVEMDSPLVYTPYIPVMKEDLKPLMDTEDGKK